MTESQAQQNIFNLALGHIGNPPITDPSDSPECQLYYPSVRDKLLTWSSWGFATLRQALARLDDSPADTEYSYQYSLDLIPPVLRVLDIDASDFRYSRETYANPSTPETQTPVILTNASTVVVKYIARVSEGLFPPLFTDTLGLWLGVAIAQRHSGKASLRKQLFDELQVQLQRLIDVDGHQDSPKIAISNRYLAVRGEYYGLPDMADIEEAL